MTVRVEVLEDPPLSPDGRVDLDRLVARLRRLGPVDVLESAPGNPQTRRWSYVIPHPRTVLLGDVRSVRMARDDAPDEQLSGGPLSALDEVGVRLGITPEGERDADLPPLTGGLGVVRRRGADAARGQRSGRPASPTHALVAGRGSRGSRRGRGTCAGTSVARGEPDPGLDRVPARWQADTHALYRALRERSPALHAPVIEACGIASISPEIFLKVEWGEVTVRPIKGTRPRAPDPQEDAEAARELLASEKDRAENVMVVDMERNDLGRVCRVGSEP